jgi:hypothetical protein
MLVNFIGSVPFYTIPQLLLELVFAAVLKMNQNQNKGV